MKPENKRLSEELEAHKIEDAAETQKGHIQLATTTEVTTGTEDTKAVTPKNLKTKLDKKISNSLLTAAGDMIYASAANTSARLAKGTDGQTLILSNGLPSWGNTGQFVKIIETVLSSTTASFSFSSIPTGYKYFQVACDVKSYNATGDYIQLTFNNDTTSGHYGYNSIESSSSLSSTAVNTAPYVKIGNMIIASGFWATCNILISQLDTTKNKSCYAISNGYMSSQFYTTINSGIWTNTTSEISIITLKSDSTQFATGSKFTLWGCK